MKTVRTPVLGSYTDLSVTNVETHIKIIMHVLIDRFACFSRVPVRGRQHRAAAKIRLLHRADIRAERAHRHTVVGKLLARSPLRARQDFPGSSHRSHYDDAEFRSTCRPSQSLLRESEFTIMFSNNCVSWFKFLKVCDNK